jgi:hypothetical protein
VRPGVEHGGQVPVLGQRFFLIDDTIVFDKNIFTFDGVIYVKVRGRKQKVWHLF